MAYQGSTPGLIPADASGVSFTPTGNVAGTNLQTAIAEVDGDLTTITNTRKWVEVFDQTLIANATQFTNVNITGYRILRFEILFIPNSGAASDPGLLFRAATDGVPNMLTGGTDYTNQNHIAYGTTRDSSSGNSSSGLVTLNSLRASSSIAAQIVGTIFNGSSLSRSALLSHYFGYNSAVLTGTYDSYVNVLSPLTHIQFYANVASGLGIGSRLTIEGRV